MKPGRIISKPVVMLLAVGLFLAFTVSLMAQVTSETTTTTGAGTKEVKVERGEVVYVSGDHIIIRMENGEIRDIPDVPDSARASVGGREIGVRDVKVGMKLQKTIITTTTPKMITKVERVTGKVFYVQPPNSVILTMDNNQNQQFKIPKGQKFAVEGQMVDAWGLKKGMIVTATRVTETPETHVAMESMLSGKMPPPPPPPPETPVIIVTEPEPGAPAAPAPPAPEPGKPAATTATAPEPAPPAAAEPAAPEPAAPAAPQPAAPETTMSPLLWVGLIVLVVVIVVIVVVARKKREKR